MRITSARILHARRNRMSNRVEAVVLLTARLATDLPDDAVRLAVSAPARTEPGGAPLRHRLIAAAKLSYAAAGRGGVTARRYAA